MKTTDFDYLLEESMIAQYPVSPRDNSRLMIIDREIGIIKECRFNEIIDQLDNDTVIVFNETKVIKARLNGYIILKDGRKKEVEIFLLVEIKNKLWECSVFPGERLKPGRIIYFEKDGINISGSVKEITYSGRIIEFDKGGHEFFEIIEKIGEVPLPPYIQKQDQKMSEYNTVFAKTLGSAAAPTAGLHFTTELIEKIHNKGIVTEKVLLHVGLGTFKPISTELIHDHEIHTEKIYIKKETSIRLNRYKKEGKKIIAVGTTVARTLESFVNEEYEIGYGEKDTNIYIYPPYKFRFIDELITNFHFPKSSLLILVSAFYDKDKILGVYEHAKKNNYRFMSFGDAMRIK